MSDFEQYNIKSRHYQAGKKFWCVNTSENSNFTKWNEYEVINHNGATGTVLLKCDFGMEAIPSVAFRRFNVSGMHLEGTRMTLIPSELIEQETIFQAKLSDGDIREYI